jgi:hypothetical protein
LSAAKVSDDSATTLVTDTRANRVIRLLTPVRT